MREVSYESFENRPIKLLYGMILYLIDTSVEQVLKYLALLCCYAILTSGPRTIFTSYTGTKAL